MLNKHGTGELCVRRLIYSADIGTFLGTLGWMLFWFDHIPVHALHTHFITGFTFLGGLSCGLTGVYVMILTRKRLGSVSHRFFHVIMICYTLLVSTSGIYAYLVFPPL